MLSLARLPDLTASEFHPDRSPTSDWCRVLTGARRPDPTAREFLLGGLWDRVLMRARLPDSTARELHLDYSPTYD